MHTCTFLLLSSSLGLASLPAFAKESIYDFTLPGLKGKPLALEAYKNKVLMIVNTASHCGYTKQYGGLERLYKAHKAEGFEVIGVPSGSFKQEFKDDSEVAQFCKFNFGVSFSMSKIVEVNGKQQDPLFAYLVKQAPAEAAGPVEWNFEKFLIDRQGEVVARYRSAVSPDDPKIEAKIKELLTIKAAKK